MKAIHHACVLAVWAAVVYRSRGGRRLFKTCVYRTSERPAFIRDRHLRHKAIAHSMIYLPSLALIRFGRRRSMFPTFVWKVARITKLLWIRHTVVL